MKDFSVVEYDPADMMVILGEMDEYPEWIYSKGKWGPAYTFVSPDNHIIGCAGIMLYTHTFGEVWLSTGPYWQKYRKEAVIITGKLFNKWDKEYNLLRTQAVVDSDNETNIRFIEHYGFDREGLMKAFRTDGGDVYMYAKVRR